MLALILCFLRRRRGAQKTPSLLQAAALVRNGSGGAPNIAATASDGFVVGISGARTSPKAKSTKIPGPKARSGRRASEERRAMHLSAMALARNLRARSPPLEEPAAAPKIAAVDLMAQSSGRSLSPLSSSPSERSSAFVAGPLDAGKGVDFSHRRMEAPMSPLASSRRIVSGEFSHENPIIAGGRVVETPTVVQSGLSTRSLLSSPARPPPVLPLPRPDAPLDTMSLRQAQATAVASSSSPDAHPHAHISFDGEAALWLHRAAYSGHANAQLTLGVSLAASPGRGAVSPDRSRAIEWLRSSAESGNVDAAYHLALILAGVGVEPREGATRAGPQIPLRPSPPRPRPGSTSATVDSQPVLPLPFSSKPTAASERCAADMPPNRSHTELFEAFGSVTQESRPIVAERLRSAAALAALDIGRIHKLPTASTWMTAKQHDAVEEGRSPP
jgi:hypothetical protein